LALQTIVKYAGGMTTSDPARPSRASEQAELIDVLVQSAFMTMALLSSLAADNDLSLTQLRALAILRDRRVRMSALADFLGLDRSTMSGLVERAEKRGLVARAPDPSDGRAVEVFLTSEGAELADAQYTRFEQLLIPATGRLDADQRRLLGTLLRQVVGPER
jgi:MarR family transcriptional regulator, organic hydroperoxide resistance regulator